MKRMTVKEIGRAGCRPVKLESTRRSNNCGEVNRTVCDVFVGSNAIFNTAK